MKRATKIILAIGLVLVVGGTAAAVAKHRYWRFGPDGKAFAEYLSEELKLDEQQAMRLESLRRLAVRIRNESRSHGDEQREQILSLISAPTMDQELALKLVGDKADSITQRAPEVIAALAVFTDSLSAEQKQQIETMAREHAAGGRCGHFDDRDDRG